MGPLPSHLPPQALSLVSPHHCLGQDTLGRADFDATKQGPCARQDQGHRCLSIHVLTPPSPLQALGTRSLSEGSSAQDPLAEAPATGEMVLSL